VGLDPIAVLWLMQIPIFELFTSTTRRLVRLMGRTAALVPASGPGGEPLNLPKRSR
jgi:hypothetical protein